MFLLLYRIGVAADFQSGAVVGGHSVFQIDGIFDASGLEAGVHGQLRQANVSRGDGHMGQRNVAQSRAAGDVSPVEIGLDGDIGLVADFPEKSGGNSIRA